MLNRALCALVRLILGLRYRIEVSGLDEVARRGRERILFLPSHPALIDPVLVLSVLYPKFAPHTIADQDGGADGPGFRWLSQRFGVRIMPLVFKRGPEARKAIEAVMEESARGLSNGENLLMYPAGHLLRSNREELGANSAVEFFLHDVPELRVVLLRTRGLWGSRFSCAREGHDPDFAREFLTGLRIAFANLLFFTPRRRVTIELVEPADLPRNADRTTLNRYLEDFYNQAPLPRSTHVPYFFWEGSTPLELPEPVRAARTGELEEVPAATRDIVTRYLKEVSGKEALSDTDLLGDDLGLDSLARAEVLAWLSGEFGYPQGNVDALQTVGDVLLAACGEALSGGPAVVSPPSPRWFAAEGRERLTIPTGETIPEVFLAQAQRRMGNVIAADETGGARTYRDLLTAICVLLPVISKLPGRTVGIMLPASVTAVVVYLTALFAGKVPVILNWTVGSRNLVHALGVAEVESVLTSEALVRRVAAQGTEFGGAEERFVFLETVAKGLTRSAKLRGWLRARTAWRGLGRAKVPSTAVILFTSGSESLPKAVPLTHANLLTNLRDVIGQVRLEERDRLLAMLPPFHSFGLTGNLLLSVLGGLPAVFHPNPTEGATLARLIGTYQVTISLGTPTFLFGILRASTAEQLQSLRLAVTGAEECPPRVYTMLAERAPHATILEGYGITECSPIVALNDETSPQPGTIGRTIPSLQRVIVDLDSDAPVEAGKAGMLLLRGPTIFAGYLGDAPSPFVPFEGVNWYRTGDLVCEGTDGVLTFRGRLKRFVKIGGEMISLPAIETVLADAETSAGTAADAGDSDGPSLAVVATSTGDRPELVLFTTRGITREGANQWIRSAGLSPLHNIRRVHPVESVPQLGTGKVDYRSLQELASAAPSEGGS
ncbi:MAG: AMP-binding protein [Candidatus Eisenbacteria bacterium]